MNTSQGTLSFVQITPTPQFVAFFLEVFPKVVLILKFLDLGLQSFITRTPIVIPDEMRRSARPHLDQSLILAKTSSRGRK